VFIVVIGVYFAEYERKVKVNPGTIAGLGLQTVGCLMIAWVLLGGRRRGMGMGGGGGSLMGLD